MPKWLDDAVFYEIYPQSFLDTNADGSRITATGVSAGIYRIRE